MDEIILSLFSNSFDFSRFLNTFYFERSEAEIFFFGVSVFKSLHDESFLNSIDSREIISKVLMNQGNPYAKRVDNYSHKKLNFEFLYTSSESLIVSTNRQKKKFILH